MDFPFPVYAYWCMMAITGPFCVLMTPPAVTMGISLILWLSIPWMSTVRPVFDMTRTSSPAIPPFAPRSTNELLLLADWHEEMAYTIDAVLTCQYMIPLRFTSWGLSTFTLLAVGDMSRLTLPGGSGFLLVI